MGPKQTLLAVFLGLYLLECVAWVRPGEQLFVRGLWGAFRRRLGGLWLKAFLPGGSALLLPPAAGALERPPAEGAVEAVKARVEAYEAKASWLNLSGLTLVLSIAGLLFLLTRDTYGFSLAVRAMIFTGLIVAAHLSNLLLLGLFWAKLHKQEPGRGGALLIAGVSPWASSRAADLLGRPVLKGVHPAAAAEALLGEAERRELAAAWLRQALYPRAGERADAEAWQAWLSGQGYDPKELLAAPASSQESSRSYCPRCLAQYTHAQGQCSDCGITLKAFA